MRRARSTSLGGTARDLQHVALQHARGQATNYGENTAVAFGRVDYSHFRTTR